MKGRGERSIEEKGGRKVWVAVVEEEEEEEAISCVERGE